MSLAIVPIQVQDVQTLHRISIDTFEEAFGADNNPKHIAEYMSAAFAIKQLMTELENEKSEFYFIKYRGLVAGYLKLNKGTAQTENVDPNWVEIERIYVLAKYQGQGLGQQLIEHALMRAVALNATIIWLGVWEFNHTAIRFYQKNGFTKFGQHVFHFGDDDQIDILMRRSV